jgi:hypothetical protein
MGSALLSLGMVRRCAEDLAYACVDIAAYVYK